MGQGQRARHDPLAGSWPGPSKAPSGRDPGVLGPRACNAVLSTLVTFATNTQDAGGDMAPKQRRPVAISARKWRRRGTPPIDIAPKRELYIHHTVTSNGRRTRAEERPAHARPRAGPAPVTARNDAYREGGVCRQFRGSRPACGANPVAARWGVFVCSRHRPAAHPRRQGRRGRASHLRTRTLAVRRVRLQAQGGQVALPHQRVQARVPVDQCKPPPHPHPARQRPLTQALPRTCRR